MRPRWKHVVIVCPERVTGGPEALHQLAAAINTIGQDANLASIAYVWGPSVTLQDGETITCTPHHGSKTLFAYADYDPRFADRVPLGPDTLVVFPEVLTAAVTSTV